MDDDGTERAPPAAQRREHAGAVEHGTLEAEGLDREVSLGV